MQSINDIRYFNIVSSKSDLDFIERYLCFAVYYKFINGKGSMKVTVNFAHVKHNSFLIHSE